MQRAQPQRRRVPAPPWTVDPETEPVLARPGSLAHAVSHVLRASTAQAPPSDDRAAVEAESGTPVDAVTHRGPAVDRTLSPWNTPAATVGHDILLSDDAGSADVRHELRHVIQAGNQASDLGKEMSLGQVDDPEERGTAAVGGSSPQVIRRAPPRVATPAWPPAPTPPEAYAPTGGRRDAEGNILAQSPAGTWYLAEAPGRIDFPIRDGYDYRLLPPNPNGSYRALYAECLRVRDVQAAVATRLKGNGKYWFAKVYYYVTVHELEKLEDGAYQYPHMKMQEVIQFFNTYQANLATWEGDRTSLEPNWAAAFSAAESAPNRYSESLEVKNALLPSIEAHIRFDLPRAIAAVYTTHYAGVPGASLRAFQGDFYAMASVFDQANTDLSEEIDDAGTDFNPTNWQPAGDVAFPFLFSVSKEREMAWEKAEIIASSSRTGVGLDPRLRSTMGAAHPNWSPFDVDDSTIRGYDWLTQPGLRQDTQPGPMPLPPPTPEPAFRLYFRLNRPDREMELADAVRLDQDLRPLLRLAGWLRSVSGAYIVLDGHASSEGTEFDNDNLASARGFLVEHFLFRASADLKHNTIIQAPQGETGASPTPAWRYVGVTVLWPGHRKDTTWPPADRPPSEAR